MCESRTAYYKRMKALARQVRAEYELNTPRVTRSELRKIYRKEGIRVDLWPPKPHSNGRPRGRTLRSLRGAYFNDDLGPSVLIARHLPEDPRVFTMAHELKHHRVDNHLVCVVCDTSNENEMIEIGAEVFAAELIFPEVDFVNLLGELGVSIGDCQPKHLVQLKRETRTTLSYTGLAKRAEFLELAPRGSLHGVHWKRLEEQIYGEPLYKRLRRPPRGE